MPTPHAGAVTVVAARKAGVTHGFADAVVARHRRFRVTHKLDCTLPVVDTATASPVPA